MRLIYALLSLALATPALAQTSTPVLTVGSPLVDGSPGDGKIVLSTKRSAAFPAKTAINSEPCPVTALTPAYSYTKVGVACPTPAPVVEPTPDPTPTPPPPPVVVPAPSADTVTALLPAGTSSTGGRVGPEFFSRSIAAGVHFGFNEGGGYGTIRGGPAGFVGYSASGNRIGMFHQGRGVDGLLHGRVAAGFRVGYTIGTKAYVHTNQRLSGLSGIGGAWTADGVWLGATPEGFTVQQAVAQAGGRMRHTVSVANGSAYTLSKVRFQFQIDGDMDDDAPAGWVGSYDRDKIAFPTRFKVVAPGTLTIDYLGAGAGLSTYLHSVDPRARVSTYGTSTALGSIYDPVAFTSPQAVGYTRTWDGLGNITFELGEFAPGVATTIVFDTGLADDVSAIGAAD